MNRLAKLKAINIALLICAAVCLVCYDIFGGLWLKGVTSCWFAALGILNFAACQKSGCTRLRAAGLITAGLVCGPLADVLLGINFILGVLFFAVGHIFYMVAFFALKKLSKRDLYLYLPVAAVSVFVVVGTPFIQIGDPLLQKLLVGYALIISAMLGKAISNYLAERTAVSLLIMIAACLFWFSDLMLAVDMFGTSNRLVWILCSYSYWPAQNILAHSLYYLRENDKEALAKESKVC